MKEVNTIVATGLLMLIYSAPSHAYLDPGTGSLLLQIVLGGVAGLVVAGKLMWTRILAFFGIRRGSSSEASDRDQE